MLRIYSADPGHTALKERSREKTYGTFQTDVEALCRILTQKNIRKLALIAHQSYESYCWLWAVYLTGGTFCCLNTDYPSERLVRCLDLFAPDVVLTDDPGKALPNRRLYPISPEEAHKLPLFPVPEHSVNQVLYVLMTSGSTGTPKGVRIRRSAFEDVVISAADIFGLSKADIMGQFSNISFDMGIFDVFASFYSGATVVPIVGIDKLRPASVIAREKITFLFSVPNILDIMEKRRSLDREHLGSLRAMAFAGATFFERHARLLFACREDITLINSYGPTEITVISSYVVLNRNNYLSFCDGSVCIGQPLPNVRQYPVPVSEDLYEVIVEGSHIMDGYMRSDAPDTSCANSGMTRFPTGDLVRIKDGELYFVCRSDAQTKVMGNRVDICEIDSYIRKSGFQNSVVMVVSDQLVAFLEGAVPETALTELKTALAQHLPAYSIPSRFFVLPEFPYNANGKYDRPQLTGIALERLQNGNP